MEGGKRTRSELITAAWQQGVLSWKLRDYQKPIYNAIQKAAKDPEVLKLGLNCTRRGGKSFVFLLDACEFAIQNPNYQLHFCAPSQKSIEKSILPILKIIHEDCPQRLKPIWRSQKGRMEWPNGTIMSIAGTDGGHYKNLRGHNSHRNYIDEAGACDNLRHIMTSILMPQTLHSQGLTLLASTPSEEGQDHDWYHIYQECVEDGNSVEFTIDDIGLGPRIIELYAKECGGRTSTTFRREYLCEFIVEEGRALVPEWKEEKYKQDYPRDPELFRFYHKYLSMDTGFNHFTAILFAYYDFQEAKLVIEDETILKGTEVTTLSIKEAVDKKNQELWPGETIYRRIADNNDPIVLNDLNINHGLYFYPTNKDSLNAMVNKVRLWVDGGRIIVNPRCAQLLGCLNYGVWDKKRKAFDYSTVYGHYDAFAALVYLVRNVSDHTNPIPENYGFSPNNQYKMPSAQPDHELAKLIPEKLRSNPGRRVGKRHATQGGYFQ